MHYLKFRLLFSFLLMFFMCTGISFAAKYTVSAVYSHPGNSLYLGDIENNQIAFLKYKDSNNQEIFLYDGYRIVQITSNCGRKRTPLLSGGTVYWMEYDDGTSVTEWFQYRHGTVTSIPNSKTESFINSFMADAGNLAWINKNSSGDWEVLLCNGQSTSVLASGDAFKHSIKLDGQTVTWVESNIGIFYYDGAVKTTTKVASISSFVPGLHVQDGTVYWLENVSDLNVELFAWNSGVTRQLTKNGGDKKLLSIDDGIIAWVKQTTKGSGTLYVYENNQVQLVTEDYPTLRQPRVSGSTVVWHQYDVWPKTSIMKYTTGDPTTQLVAISPGSFPPVISNGYIAWTNLANDIHTVNLATPCIRSGDVVDLGEEHARKVIEFCGAVTLQVSEWNPWWGNWTPTTIVVAITTTDGQPFDGITVMTTTSEAAGTFFLNLSKYGATVTLVYTSAPIQFQIDTAAGKREVSTTWWAQ